MFNLQDFRTAAWAFMEAYGWLTVLILILTYVIYKKYIYDVQRAQTEERKIQRQKQFDRQVQEKEQDNIRLARERQQKEHNEKERSERIKREQKEKEETEKKKKELEEGETTCNIVGHHQSTVTSPVTTKSKKEQANEIIDNLFGSTSIIIFGYSTCPNFRKVCQLVSTYRLDITKFQVFEFDKHPEWPVEEILKVLENCFQTKESPFIFICGEYIGGLEETRIYDRNNGLDKTI